MFSDIRVPYGTKMLYNVVKLKPEYSIEDAELAIGDMCNTVKNEYANSGFIAGQVFNYAGFISDEGSVSENKDVDNHLIIITYWTSFDQHEKSHADPLFKSKFTVLEDMCEETFELGYDMLWQGEPD